MAIILTVLLVASVPQFAQSARRLQVEQAAFELVQLLRYARERAVAERAVVHWVWDPDTQAAHLEQADETGLRTRLPGRLTTTAPLDRDLALTFVEEAGAPGELSFFPDGTSEPATLTVTAREHSYTVVVDGVTGQTAISAGLPAR